MAIPHFQLHHLITLLIIFLANPLRRVIAFPSSATPLFLSHSRVCTVRLSGGPTIPNADVIVSETADPLTHQEIRWVLRPCEDPSWKKMWQWRFWGVYNYLQFRLFRGLSERPLFPILPQTSPKDHLPSRLVLYAYIHHKPIGRFGIVPDAGDGPPPEAMLQAAQRLNLNTTELRAAAIIYMFVEPEYRGRSVGSLALSVLSHVHASRDCSCTVLVANDSQARSIATVVDASVDERLVQWYERNGYFRAPELQELLGSPNGRLGITMMAPTRFQPDAPFRIQWW